MAASTEFVQYVRDLLAPLGEMKDGRFFGGHAFKREGLQFAMVMGNTLYFCVNDETRDKYKAHDMTPFSYGTRKGRVQVRKYYTVPEHLFDDQDALVEWAREAINSARNGRSQ